MKNPKREIEDIGRFQQIIKIIASNGFGFALNKLNIYHSYSTEDAGPEKLRETIEKLGPTFIKFGQIMAERPDIIPVNYAKELEKLQDNVPAFDAEEAMKIVDEEIGQEKFQNIEKEPIAAASIAQVHRATLENGDEVVVKVRRPGIKQQIAKDLDIILYFAKKAEKHFKKAKSARVSRLAREFANWTQNELDLEKEAQNAQIFKENMSSEENIYIPEVYPQITTEKVLVMEYIDGVKCTNLEKLEEYGVKPEDMARTALRAGLKQVIKDGFFHADPHPSNFLIQEDGTFTYLDFGMMGEVTKNLRNKVGLLFLYMLDEDAERALQIMQDIGYTEEDANLERVEEMLNHKILKLRNSKISQASVSREFFELAIKAGQNGLHFPISITLMGKNLITMEGIGLEIYPDFKITEEYKKLGEQLLLENNRPEKLFKDVMLDLIENKDMITHPGNQIRKAMSQPTEVKTRPVETDIEFEFLTPALIISSTALIAASIYEPVLLYIGLIELAIGIYLYLR